MSVGPSITQCCLCVGFLQFLLLQGFSHAATSFRSSRKERKHLEQRQRVKRLTTDGKYRTYLQFSSHKDSSNSAFLSTEKLTYMFTKLSVFGVEMPDLLHFLVAIWMLRVFCVSRTRLSGYKDDALLSEWQRNSVFSSMWELSGSRGARMINWQKPSL